VAVVVEEVGVWGESLVLVEDVAEDDGQRIASNSHHPMMLQSHLHREQRVPLSLYLPE